MTGDEMAERGTDRWIKAHQLEVLQQIVVLLESINTNDGVQGAINFLLYGDTRGYVHEPLAHSRQNEHELKAQLEEALGIIKDLGDLHDSYIGHLYSHGMYKEEPIKAIAERIQVLRLKQ